MSTPHHCGNYHCAGDCGEPGCEFCDLDDYGQHAPRCPVALQSQLTAVEKERDALRTREARIREIADAGWHDEPFALRACQQILAELDKGADGETK